VLNRRDYHLTAHATTLSK